MKVRGGGISWEDSRGEPPRAGEHKEEGGREVQRKKSKARKQEANSGAEGMSEVRADDGTVGDAAKEVKVIIKSWGTRTIGECTRDLKLSEGTKAIMKAWNKTSQDFKAKPKLKELHSVFADIEGQTMPSTREGVSRAFMDVRCLFQNRQQKKNPKDIMSAEE